MDASYVSWVEFPHIISELHFQKSSPGLCFMSVPSSSNNLYLFVSIDLLVLIEMIFLECWKEKNSGLDQGFVFMGPLFNWCD